MGKKRSSGTDRGLEAWAADLARKVQEGSPGTTLSATSKAVRIEKRQAKRARRLDNKVESVNAKSKLPVDIPVPKSAYKAKPATTVAAKQDSSSTAHTHLRRLAQLVDERVLSVKQACAANARRPKPYSPTPVISKKRRRQRDDSIQPRASDYGGIGLARESLNITFDDPSWQPKLEQEFAEHIAGFYGKQRTKAMKKQLDGNMLWRRLLADKQTSHVTKGTKKLSIQATAHGKKLSSLTPDERVEALIRAGLV
jgi:hypothetical protein